MSRVRKYRVDPDDPRAPSLEVWAQLTEAERAAVVAELPSEFPVSERAPPEGDPHFNAKVAVKLTLRRYFERLGRRVYLACELPVYYPGEPMFAPDVIAVADVETHEREHWVVTTEGKGLDVAFEIHYSGRRLKDLERNRDWYARLGIPEYFVFDRKRLRLWAYRLPSPRAETYEAIAPQQGRYRCRQLGLELGLDGEKLRFYSGTAAVPEDDELIARLESMVESLDSRRRQEERRRVEEAERRVQEEERRVEAEQRGREAERLREEEARRRADAERRLADALAELERVRGNGPGSGESPR